MIYADLVNFISVVFQIPITTATLAQPFQDPSANTFLPDVIALAEQTIYTDMDFVATRTQDTSTTFTSGNRLLTLPTGAMVVEGVAQIVPAGQTNPNSGTRNQLEPVSLDVIDMFYPSASTTTGAGEYWAMRDAATIVVGPTPDASYTAEVTATFRPAPISSTNTSTYISTTYPQLLMAAVAFYMAGYQRDFGAQSEDPKLASSWKATYDYILPSCQMEEKRRKGESVQNSKTSSEAPPASPSSKAAD